MGLTEYKVNIYPIFTIIGHFYFPLHKKAMVLNPPVKSAERRDDDPPPTVTLGE